MPAPTQPSSAHGGARTLRVAVGLLIVSLVLTVGTGTAAAHATLTGAEPVNGATLAAVPERLELRVAGKAATAEGDPVQVYDPTGRRVDTGQVHVPETGDVIHAYLDAAAISAGTEGEYQVLYEIVSADTHVISGRLAFTVQAGAAADAASTRSLSFSVGPAAGEGAAEPAVPAATPGAAGAGGNVADVGSRTAPTGLARTGPVVLPVVVLAACAGLALLPLWSRRRRLRA